MKKLLLASVGMGVLALLATSANAADTTTSPPRLSFCSRAARFTIDPK